jgi:hypothetical protein
MISLNERFKSHIILRNYFGNEKDELLGLNDVWVILLSVNCLEDGKGLIKKNNGLRVVVHLKKQLGLESVG